MEKKQFLILYRQFLFRMVDLELLSASAQGDVSRLLGQCAALLIFVSMILAGLGGSFLGAVIPPSQIVAVALEDEHFLIATTMLVVGLFAVLSWDSTFPSRLDVMVVAPLPVRAKILFLAKVSALATALGLTVLSLHVLAGLVWPVALAKRAVPYRAPVLTYDPASPPVGAADLKLVVDQDLARGPTPLIGAFAAGTGLGATIGVWKRGERRVFTYGAAKPDSLFEIGSITKTFTGLLLAEMMVEGKVSLDEPVRELLPAGVAAKPEGGEITLLDLATHHSGLPRMPDNFQTASRSGTYTSADMYAYVARHGVAKQGAAPFVYSNFGYALLGTALSNRAGTSYPELIKQGVTSPLGLTDTDGPLSAEQHDRKMTGFDAQNDPIRGGHWEQGAMAPSGYFNSSAPDMLAYLEAQLHPERLISDTLAAAIRESHKLRADGEPGSRIAIAWNYDADTGTFLHGGSSPGYTAFALFNPREDYAAVVLLNSGPPSIAGLLGDHVAQRLAGKPAISLASVQVSPSHGVLSVARYFIAYWVTMFAAGAFTFCCVLGLQGLAAQALPRRVFLRVSSFLQIGVLCLFVTLYFLEPSPVGLLVAENFRVMTWIPTYWFLGFLQQASGSSALATLATRAWIGLAISCCATAAAYALSYLRTLRRIVEEPDLVPGSAGMHWLPRFGNSLETAIVQFGIRTLLRSRQHRVMLAFFLGLGFALVILLVKTPAQQQALHRADAGLLFATIAVMCIAVVGTRVVFSMPINLRANWIFRITQVHEPWRYLVAIRRPLFVVAVAPVWIISATLLFSLWPWRQASEHLIVLGLVGTIVAYLSLYGFQKIPFTCSYLPGKSYLHMAFLTAVGLMLLIGRGVELEIKALTARTSYLIMVAILIIAAGFARSRTIWRASEDDAVVQFEDTLTPAIQVLGLNRDGVVTTEAATARPSS